MKSDLCRLVVTAKGFQSAVHDVDMHYLASRYPNIYLVPLREKKSSPSTPSITSATDLKAPKSAQKEYEKGNRALGERESSGGAGAP